MTADWSYEGIDAYHTKDDGDDLELTDVLAVQRAILHQNGPGVRYVVLTEAGLIGTADGTTPDFEVSEHDCFDFQRVGVVCKWNDDDGHRGFAGIVHAAPTEADDGAVPWFWERWDDENVMNPEAASEWWHSQGDEEGDSA